MFRPQPSSRVSSLDKEFVPAGVYSFATDSGGNGICFAYRVSPDAPSLAFYNAEQEGDEAIMSLANSFTEFLDALY